MCGILAGPRVDEVDGNVFQTSSRINSTWGGNLVDMVRFDRILEVIEAEDLIGNVNTQGAHLMARLGAMEERFEGVTDARGRGLFCAFDLPDTASRNAVLKAAYDEGLMALGCGPRSIRFRPALTISQADLNAGLEILEGALVTGLEG